MLVLVSDLHLMDHPAGNPQLEQDLIHFLRQILERARCLRACEKVEIVLLGDIFDLLNSCQWTTTPVRPWQPHGPALDALLTDILEGILERFPDLVRLISELKENKEVVIEFEYVIGNHDFLLNSDVAQGARRKVRSIFGPHGGSAARFPHRVILPDYGVIAMHGHDFDPWNSVRGMLWPFGDAVVIELFRGFLRAVAERLRLNPEDPFMRQLEEIYYVRPESLAPFWTRAASRQFGITNTQKRAIKGAWKEAIKALFSMNYVCENITRYRKIPRFKRHELALRGSALFDPLWLPAILRKRLAGHRDPIRYERRVRTMLATDPLSRFVVAGHTHRPGLFHLELLRENWQPRIYINSGTWRQVHVPVVFGNESYIHFSSEFVSTYVVFYNPAERQEMGKEYEFCRLHTSWRQ